MFPGWRLKLREARHAIAGGQWDAAAELLASPQLREFRPAKKLSRELANRLVNRAGDRMAGGESMAGWHDLHQAARLGADEQSLDLFRRGQAEQRMDEVYALLARGDGAAARAALARMDDHRLGGKERRVWRAVAEALDHASGRAAHGDFAAAVLSLEEALRMLPAGAPTEIHDRFADRLAECRGRLAPQQRLERELLTAMTASDWSAALSTADALLELAPQHAAARQARRRAWRAVGMEATEAYRPAAGVPARPAVWHRNLAAPRTAASTRLRVAASEGDTVNDSPREARRLVAWIDAVGGYLICLGNEIVLGQPSAAGGVDVPILADLSRRHAVIRRDGESYVLTPLHATKVDGVQVRESIVLRDKAVIRLGDAAELRFRKPHALSSTAVLEIVSHHKTEPAVDGVVLMSESCILGPQSHSHIACPDWTGELVLFRRGDDLYCRSKTPATIDGQPGVTQALVHPDSRIETGEIALSFEGLS